MTSPKTFTVIGRATSTVYLEVQASSEEEAKRIAGETSELDWVCDEVDGAVTVVGVES